MHPKHALAESGEARGAVRNPEGYMDDIKRSRLRAAAEKLMAAHDELVDLTPKKAKKTSEEDAVLGDALDSLEESISCLAELLEEE